MAFDVFTGLRPGLFDLPPLPITVLTGNKFGVALSKRALTQAADARLRELQQGAGLLNDDTGWLLRINRNSRKKIGDNKDQTIAALKAVAGIEALAKHAVVGEIHGDDEHRNPDVKAILRLYAPLMIESKLYRAKLTVKHYTTEGDPKLLHALAAVEIENAPLGTLPAYSGDESLQQGQPTTGRTVSIADLLCGAIANDGKGFTADHIGNNRQP